MSFRKYQPETAGKSRPKNSVRVKRSYYTFSKYYPAGDTNRVYRKSISRSRRIRRSRIAAGILAGAAAAAVIVIFLIIILY